ncbi:prepilin-type N-terminal cleavage/methylation domain-containing protein [Psychrobacillus sp. NEAU-3TGS]|uniref:PilW family protein n=1 Tax=Psychrobacillus sp. NEAU-3TGS TaxID=2995412 RepID=UPI002496E271|nr:prepilin-type N-terminal cleavage/methylation domain-containing protein [Psychrobacillus sp. NEAU-3TGS]MDI2588257.1 prepilin-type N-terminal cleavage/methylation domain-containing protein [Psychrobacillus sp. NEAU-3TGS]
MRKHLNNGKGITLVELLAAIVLASIVMLLVYSLLMSGTKQYKNQLEKNNQLTDISYALKMITKDIRKTENPQIISNSKIKLDGINYSLDGNTITRNGVVIASSIKRFQVTSENDKWFIEIESSNRAGVEKTEKTEVYLRKGDE